MQIMKFVIFGHDEGMKKPNLKAELLQVWQQPCGFPLAVDCYTRDIDSIGETHARKNPIRSSIGFQFQLWLNFVSRLPLNFLICCIHLRTLVKIKESSERCLTI